MDLISVIIPFYKKKNFIKKTIDSVLNQTHDNFEIIIIYDDPEKRDLKYLIHKTIYIVEDEYSLKPFLFDF